MNGKLIQQQDSRKAFDDFTAVDGTHFEVRPGDIFSRVGPSRVGKSASINNLDELPQPGQDGVYIPGILTPREAIQVSCSSPRLNPGGDLLERLDRLIDTLNVWMVVMQGQRKSSGLGQVLEICLNAESSTRLCPGDMDQLGYLFLSAVRNGIQTEFTTALPNAFPTCTPPAQAAHGLPTNMSGLIEPLSRREMEVLHLIAAGLSNKEIGQRLFISLRTVKYHTTSIYTKMDVTGRVQATAKGRELGLLQ